MGGRNPINKRLHCESKTVYPLACLVHCFFCACWGGNREQGTVPVCGIVGSGDGNRCRSVQDGSGVRALGKGSGPGCGMCTGTWCWLLLAWVLAVPAAMAGARPGTLTIRVRRGATIAVLSVRGPATYRWVSSNHPPRLVLDLRGSMRGAAFHPVPTGVVRSVHVGVHGDRDLRLVFDLHRATSVRVAVRRGHEHTMRLRIVFGKEAPPALARRPLARRADHPRAVLRAGVRTGPVIVAVDPGHGGIDPGTTGAGGLHEKTVTLAIGRMVARKIDATPGMRAVLTRDGNYYVSLRERVLDAQRHHADLFVSIHVNSFPRSPRIAGGAVYMLSEHGASDAEARMVARTENAADPTIDGVHFSHNDRRLNYVLTDLLQNQAIAAGDRLGGDILRHLARVEPLYEPRVQRANFEVLRDPMIPSVLVETAFLSNPRQDRQLHERRFLDGLADAIYGGIREYVRAHFPGRGTREYVVRNGDTLSAIAVRSGVSIRRLQAFNHLSGSDIAAGQVLRIPPGSG
ncbi:MAG TPA: LysM peptidoglycan-binding domain-containing protein [Gammaproteobacteria bacterium]|nr:LysM peptidoglycan-binding domain-containing protein [Gammaproteobacteria bacterium]